MDTWKRLGIALSLFMGLGSGAYASALTQASRASVNHTISAQGDQSFAALMQQAEQAANQLVQQAFDVNPDATEVTIEVTGERQGQKAPLLKALVPRTHWQSNSNVQSWSHEFRIARYLLGFEVQPTPSSATTPNSSPTDTQNSSPSPSPAYSGGSPLSPSAVEPGSALPKTSPSVSPSPISAPSNEEAPEAENGMPNNR
jgi:hypothetical protein